MKKTMSTKRFGISARFLPLLLSLLLLLSVLGMAACDEFVEELIPEQKTESSTKGETEASTQSQTIFIPSEDSESEGKDTENETEPEREEISVHMIDVGQGDAILIMTDAGNMLIDSGDLGSTPRAQLTDYLAAQNVTSFEYVVFTHPDADHIGSGDYIINNYDVKTVIMPDCTATTKVYERLVSAIETKNVDLILIGTDTEVCEQVGYEFSLGPIQHKVLGPTENFKSTNEMSVVIRSVYNEISILFTGDAETKSEAAMLAMHAKSEFDCDILKVGHHGSNTSTSDEFLAAVSPEAALISCGEGNKFGHPKPETLDKLDAADIDTYRTDLNGSVVVKTNGLTYTITKEK